MTYGLDKTELALPKEPRLVASKASRSRESQRVHRQFLRLATSNCNSNLSLPLSPSLSLSLPLFLRSAPFQVASHTCRSSSSPGGREGKDLAPGGSMTWRVFHLSQVSSLRKASPEAEAAQTEAPRLWSQFRLGSARARRWQPTRATRDARLGEVPMEVQRGGGRFKLGALGDSPRAWEP